MNAPLQGTTGRALMLLGAIFMIGMVAGASLFYVGQRSVDRGTHPTEQPNRQRRPGPLEDMTRRLDLTQEQREAIKAILDSYRGRVDGLLEASRAEIRDVLNEEQQERFDSMRPPRGHHPPGHYPPPRRGKRSPPHRQPG